MTQRPTGRKPPSRPGRPGEQPSDSERTSSFVIVGGSIAAFLGLILLGMTALNYVSGLRQHPKSATQPVSGKIFIDKKGVEGLSLVFWPVNDDKKTPRPHATSGPGGVYHLSTYGDNDGAPPGDYKITVQWFEAVPPRKDDPDEPTTRDKLHGRYGEPRIKVQIKPGAAEIDPINLP